jgi:hypothetical protein
MQQEKFLEIWKILPIYIFSRKKNLKILPKLKCLKLLKFRCVVKFVKIYQNLMKQISRNFWLSPNSRTAKLKCRQWRKARDFSVNKLAISLVIPTRREVYTWGVYPVKCGKLRQEILGSKTSVLFWRGIYFLPGKIPLVFTSLGVIPEKRLLIYREILVCGWLKSTSHEISKTSITWVSKNLENGFTWKNHNFFF